VKQLSLRNGYCCNLAGFTLIDIVYLAELSSKNPFESRFLFPTLCGTDERRAVRGASMNFRGCCLKCPPYESRSGYSREKKGRVGEPVDAFYGITVSIDTFFEFLFTGRAFYTIRMYVCETHRASFVFHSPNSSELIYLYYRLSMKSETLFETV